MSGKTPRRALALCLSAMLASCQTLGPVPGPARPGPDAAMEARVQAIVAGMTIEQKVGQMTQAEIRSITPAEARTYYIGSMLNGGGAWPGMNKHASVADWLALTNSYYRASMTTDMPVKVPIIWGTDAVHGHNNVFGATLFPHNIGLGAAHDPALIERIGRATALQVRATGISWAFAPTLAVVENPRWGRTYESYSSDPAEVETYAEAMVRGLQGQLGSPDSVLATAKHYLGDGGTLHGQNEGDTRTSEADLLAVHGAGYRGALRAGVQTVMASYNSFTDTTTGVAWGKMHGNHHLLTDVLKQRMAFDGLVVSDWNAIGQLPGCSNWHCPAAINAGVDLVMVPDDWKKFIEATVGDVHEGRIPMSRVDDAVSRILRVKMRAGLFEGTPTAVPHPPAGVMDSLEVRALARQAVRKSLVLLKNDGGVLPLRRDARILVVGAGADSLPRQSGGWSLSWQGDDTTTADYPNAETLLAALKAELGAGNVDYSADGAGVDPSRYSAILVVASETPYAETKGDIVFPATLRHSARYPADLAALSKVAGKGVPIVTILYSGRPVGADDLINRSDAFVAAFLPGTEARGITDLLLRAPDGSVAHDFTARLSFDWPAADCISDASSFVFRRGYGLSVRQASDVGVLPDPTPMMVCPPDSR